MNNDSSRFVQHARHLSDEANSEEPVRKAKLFRASSFQFGVFETEIATIAEWREPTPLPHAPKSVLGVVSIQGRMLTVLDVAVLAGSETVSGAGSYRYILALRGDEQLAVAVSDLDEAREFSSFDSEGTSEDAERFVLGILDCQGLETGILNATKLFAAAIRGRERRRRRF